MHTATQKHTIDRATMKAVHGPYPVTLFFWGAQGDNKRKPMSLGTFEQGHRIA